MFAHQTAYGIFTSRAYKATSFVVAFAPAKATLHHSRQCLLEVKMLQAVIFAAKQLLFIAERDHRIDSGGAPRGEVCGGQRYGGDN
jgi:hypothetical protein